MKECFDMQVAVVRDFIYRNEVKKIVIIYKPLLTLIDGKILNALLGTPSTQSCPICVVNPKKLLETTDFTPNVLNQGPRL